MDAHDDSRLAPLVDALLALPVTEREAGISQRCGTDTELASRVRAALAERGAATTAPEPGVSTTATTKPGIVTDWTRQRNEAWRGKRIGPYAVTGVLGQGGMGLVLSARRSDDEPEVAIKQVRPDLVSPTLLRRLERERDLLMLLKHDQIVGFTEMGMTDEGAPYVVMEKVDGVSLDEAAAGEPLNVRVRMIRDVAFTVGHAHARAVVHRDLKPSNVMVTADRKVKLLDFGIAKVLEDEGGSTLTGTGERLLTPRYAAPEQHLGQDTSPATDVFALGVILDELSAIRSRDDKVPSAEVVTQPVETLQARTAATTGGSTTRRSHDARMDHWLDLIIAKCRAELPAERYANATQLGEDLEAWLDGRRPRAAAHLHQARRFAQAQLKQRPWLIGALGGALGLGLLLALWFRAPDETVIDSGYQIRVSDMAGMPRAAQQLVRDAIVADAHGDRERALAMMDTADTSSNGNPVPAIYLLLWHSGRGEITDKEYQRVERLLREHPNPYLDLWYRVDFSDRNKDSDAEMLRAAKALLATRPKAWRIQLSLAHRNLGAGQIEVALTYLKSIDVVAVDDRRAGQILLDRAVLGDADGAERDLPRMAGSQTGLRRVVGAAIALTRGQLDEGHAQIAPLLTAEAAEATPEIHDYAMYAKLLLLGEGGRWQEQFEGAYDLMRTSSARGNRTVAHFGSVMALISAARLGDAEQLRSTLAEARKYASNIPERTDIALLGALLGELIDHRDDLLKELGVPPSFMAGLPDLLVAADERAAGNVDVAKKHLLKAKIAGVLDTPNAAQARWLARALGEDWGPPAPKPLPWNAPLSRWMARWVEVPKP